MAFFKRGGSPADRITSKDLADFGRWEFLNDQSGVDPSGVYNLVSPLNELVFTRSSADRATVITELHRHADKGEWERVGAWKYVREFLDEAGDTQPLIDGGLLALARMRVTNLRSHLAPVDTPRYQELTGGPVPDDGFFGPPVFDSSYGPSRQYYFDNAIATAAVRAPVRVRSSAGTEPGSVHEAAKAMWNFGLLVHRGPLVVAPSIAFEPNVVRPAIVAATNVDHDRFAELLVEKVLEPSPYVQVPWPALGVARFIEDYLDPATVQNPAYARALGEGVTQLLKGGFVNVAMPAEVLSRRAYERMLQFQTRTQ